MISSPGRSARTNVGRLLFPERSENGKGITIISPFTNLAILHLLPEYSNHEPALFRWPGEFLQYLPRLLCEGLVLKAPPTVLFFLLVIV